VRRRGGRARPLTFLLLVMLVACGSTNGSPDAFVFTAITDAVPSTLVTSNAVVVGGRVDPVAVRVVGGTLVIDGVDAPLATTVAYGSSIAVRVRADPGFGRAVEATVVVGGRSAPFVVTTHAERTTWWRPAPGGSWFWQLSGDIDTSHDVDVYAIDYLTEPAIVRDLRSDGRRVIAYVPAGNWEPYRPDANDFPATAICGAIDGWPERYLDVRDETAVAIIRARIAQAARAAFDGVEGDMVDLHLVQTGCTSAITEHDATAFVEGLAAYAHALGLAYFVKNVPENAASWSTFADGVVVEEAYHYGEAGAYRAYSAAGKAVLAVEYGPGTPTIEQCADALASGFALFGTDLFLSGQVFGRCW
jgi:hypothetical protein